MTQTTITTRSFTDSLLAALRANAQSIDVGDAVAPKNPTPAYPYAVLFPEVSPILSDEGGTLADPSAHRFMEWTLVSVGQTREQAQWCSDLMRSTLLSATFSTPGRNIWRVDVAGLGEVERDDDVDLGGITGSLFYASDAISIPSSPA